MEEKKQSPGLVLQFSETADLNGIQKNLAQLTDYLQSIGMSGAIAVADSTTDTNVLDFRFGNVIASAGCIVFLEESIREPLRNIFRGRLAQGAA